MTLILSLVSMSAILLPLGECQALKGLEEDLEMLTERYISLPADGEAVLLRRSKR